MDWYDRKFFLGLLCLSISYNLLSQCALIRLNLNEFSFGETHGLVENQATAIVPVDRIDAITTGEKIGGRRLVRLLLRARLDFKYLFP